MTNANTQESILTPIIDWLTYRSYEENRMNNPDIPYFRWRKIFKDAVSFEEIYSNNVKRIYRSGI